MQAHVAQRELQNHLYVESVVIKVPTKETAPSAEAVWKNIQIDSIEANELKCQPLQLLATAGTLF